MTKTVTVGDRTLTIRATALQPRLYRYHFGRDLMIDLKRTLEASGHSLEEIQKDPYGVGLDALDITVFENLTWLMLKAGGEEVGSSPEEWLDSEDDPMLLYSLLPAVVDLWTQNLTTTSRPKKK